MRERHGLAAASSAQPGPGPQWIHVNGDRPIRVGFFQGDAQRGAWPRATRPSGCCSTRSCAIGGARSLASGHAGHSAAWPWGNLDLAFWHGDSREFEGEAASIAWARAVWGPLIVEESAPRPPPGTRAEARCGSDGLRRTR